MNSRAIPFSLVLLLCTLVYLPGMTGGFMFDDYSNILNNPHFSEPIKSFSDLEKASWSGTAGPLKRPIAMLSFAVNSAVFGNWPMGYKLTNLMIHLINGLLAFFAASLLLRATPGLELSNEALKASALLAAAVWLLHPINLTSVLYVVQRMTSLAAMFSFLSVISYCWGRIRLQRERDLSAWVSIGLLTPLFILFGAYSKENALLMVPTLFIVEVLLFRFVGFGSESTDKILKTIAWAGVAVVSVAVISFGILRPEIFTAGFEGRPFTLLERVFTEGRVLCLYFFLIVVPQLDRFSLFHDDVELSASLTDPLSTLLALAVIAIVVIAAIIFRKKSPLFSLAAGWFLVGHVMESSVFPLELIHEHRNYFPSFGICLGFAVLIIKLINRAENLNKFRHIFSAGIILILATLTFLRASAWSDPITLAVSEAENHPRSHRSVYAAARVYYGLYLIRGEREHYSRAVELLLKSAALDVSAKRPYFGLLKLAYDNNFEIDPKWRADLIFRLENTFFAHTDWVELHHLVKCHAGVQPCAIPLEDVMDFFLAALNNQTLSAPTKSQLLLDLAVLYVNKLGDFDSAIRFLDEAVELVPDKFALRITRAEILGFAGESTRLKDEIKTLSTITDWQDQHEYSEDKIAGLETRFLEKD